MYIKIKKQKIISTQQFCFLNVFKVGKITPLLFASWYHLMFVYFMKIQFTDVFAT